MNEKKYQNPNIDLYNIEFDLNNRWEQMLNDAFEKKFSAVDFYSLCADTHRFIEKYDKSEMIPHSALTLLNLLQEYSQIDYFIENRMDFFYSTVIASFISELLTKGLKDDDLGETEDIEYELLVRWNCLFEDVQEKRIFDEKFFCDLAADTFQFIKKYNKSKMIPRNALLLCVLLRTYGLYSYGYVKGNEKAFVARKIAEEFDKALLSGLNYEITDNLHPIFIIDGCGEFRIDALTFDLTEAAQNCPDWVTDEEGLQETENDI